MDFLLITVIAVVAMALIFDFSNGSNDAANSIATVVATRAMSPRKAVWFSAICNFAAYFIAGTPVANTIAKTVKVEHIGVPLIFAALFAAIAWNFLVWFFGMPSSSSHALIGGLVGAGLAAGGSNAINWHSVQKVLYAIVASPAVAFTIAVIATGLVIGVQKLTKLDDHAAPFKYGQLLSAAAVSLGHGANDAQKTMGIITALLAGTGYLAVGANGSAAVPEWVALSAYAAIAFGTVWGGWRIIHTMGMKLTKLNAKTGVAANIGATTAIFGATAMGIPISTTHAAASSVVGAGVAARRHTRWRVIGEMVAAWVITIPTTTLIGFGLFKLTQLPKPYNSIVDTIMALLLMAAITWALMNRTTHHEIETEVMELDVLDNDISPVHGGRVAEAEAAK
ncbi:MAG: inorganic phosphate transporter [Kineosporiaceae bacterium]|nr:inorganic phosphate transporter [Kineosporiaceae bacterium]